LIRVREFSGEALAEQGWGDIDRESSTHGTEKGFLAQWEETWEGIRRWARPGGQRETDGRMRRSPGPEEDDEEDAGTAGRLMASHRGREKGN